MIRAAIVGLGWWGKNLTTAVQGRSEKIGFVAGVSKEPAQVKAFAREHGMALTDNMEAVLADPAIDAIVLATPHSLHADQIVAAARAGKHVFCEKPLALTGQDARRAIAATQAAGVVLAVGQNKRFWPSMTHLREVVRAGTLGQLLHLEGHYSNQNSSNFFSSWREAPNESPAGGLTGTGIHIVDAFVAMAGRARRVSALTSRFRQGKDPRDATAVTVEFASGVAGYFGMVRATPFYWRVHAFGDAASAEATGENELVIRHRDGRTERHIHPPVDSLKAELEAFASSIGHRENPYPISTQEMQDGVDLFEAIVCSIENQQTMEINL